MIKNIEIAEMINKSKGAISHIKNTNKELFEILQIGATIKKEGLNKEDVSKLIEVYKQLKK